MRTTGWPAVSSALERVLPVAFRSKRRSTNSGRRRRLRRPEGSPSTGTSPGRACRSIRRRAARAMRRNRHGRRGENRQLVAPRHGRCAQARRPRDAGIVGGGALASHARTIMPRVEQPRDIEPHRPPQEPGRNWTAPNSARRCSGVAEEDMAEAVAARLVLERRAGIGDGDEMRARLAGPQRRLRAREEIVHAGYWARASFPICSTR